MDDFKIIKLPSDRWQEYKELGFNIVGELKKEYLIDGKFYDVYEMEKYLK